MIAKSNLLMLRSGALELALSPAVGGAIAGFHWTVRGPFPIMRESPATITNVLEAASFPLVPYVNRIRAGEFTFRHRTVRIVPNMAGDPNPLHGQGWLGPWQVEGENEAEAVLSFRHAAGEWPWDYEAQQFFAIDEHGVSIGLTCRNLSADPMPCGLGQHPYFPCGSQTRIATSVDHAWTIDEHVLPVDKVPASGRFDLTNRLVCGQGLDHGFGGWGGSARLFDPDWPFEVVMSSPSARFFQLYSPAEGGIFVAEPVTHANAALNRPEAEWAELGMRILEPGEQMRLDMRIDVRAVERRG